MIAAIHARVCACLDVEPEMHDVGFPDDVVLAFEAQAPGFLRAMLAVVGDEIVISDDLGTDEALLEVGVDLAGCLGRGSADLRRPGPHFLGAGREEGLQSQQLITGSNNAVQPRLVETEVGKELLLDFFVELRDLGLDRGADRDDLGAHGRCIFTHRIEMRIVLEARLVHVRDVHHGLRRDQV